jgi:hypothetical protein
VSNVVRVDLLTAPPVVGRFYLVRTVHAKYFGVVASWPVIGPRHEDLDHFNFGYQHYHVDFRFVRCSDERAEARHPYVLHGLSDGDRLADITALPVLRRRKCVRSALSFSVPWNAKVDPLHALREHYAGRQCVRDKAGGWICPHRNAPLGSIKPSGIERIITCPLHGLRIQADTGKVLHTAAQAGGAL